MSSTKFTFQMLSRVNNMILPRPEAEDYASFV